MSPPIFFGIQGDLNLIAFSEVAGQRGIDRRANLEPVLASRHGSFLG
jgi:hypothetical protein